MFSQTVCSFDSVLPNHFRDIVDPEFTRTGRSFTWCAKVSPHNCAFDSPLCYLETLAADDHRCSQIKRQASPLAEGVNARIDFRLRELPIPARREIVPLKVAVAYADQRITSTQDLQARPCPGRAVRRVFRAKSGMELPDWSRLRALHYLQPIALRIPT